MFLAIFPSNNTIWNTQALHFPFTISQKKCVNTLCGTNVQNIKKVLLSLMTKNNPRSGTEYHGELTADIKYCNNWPRYKGSFDRFVSQLITHTENENVFSEIILQWEPSAWGMLAPAPSQSAVLPAGCWAGVPAETAGMPVEAAGILPALLLLSVQKQ